MSISPAGVLNPGVISPGKGVINPPNFCSREFIDVDVSFAPTAWANMASDIGVYLEGNTYYNDIRIIYSKLHNRNSTYFSSRGFLCFLLRTSPTSGMFVQSSELTEPSSL